MVHRFPILVKRGYAFVIDTFLRKFLQATSSSTGITATFKATMNHGGPFALYRGVVPGMCGAFPSHAAYFAVYENVKMALNPSGKDETLTQYGMHGVGVMHVRRTSRIPGCCRGSWPSGQTVYIATIPHE